MSCPGHPIDPGPKTATMNPGRQVEKRFLQTKANLGLTYLFQRVMLSRAGLEPATL